MKFIVHLIFFSLLLCAARAVENLQEVVPTLVVNNKQYDNVRWGPMNNGKVVIFHNRGVTYVALADLPTEYQTLFNYTPPPSVTPPLGSPKPETPLVTTTPNSESPATPPPRPLQPLLPLPNPYSVSSKDREWEQYNADRKTKVVFHGKLVESATLNQVIGFIGNPGWVEEDKVRVNGTLFELAAKRDDVPSSPSAMLLRPHLWRKTGVVVLLKNYKPETEVNVLVRLFAQELPRVGDCRVYEVATQPSFEQWQKLRFSSSGIRR